MEMVGAPRFELGASSTQNLRATKLRYAPPRYGIAENYPKFNELHKASERPRFEAFCGAFCGLKAPWFFSKVYS